jgi:hypothetical protein
MNPKKKRLYTILVILTLILAVGILAWSSMYSPAEEGTTPTNTNKPNASPVVTRSASGDTTYTPPAVFPMNTSFDSSVLAQIKIFQSFQPSKLNDGELGRQNPFNNY